MTKLKPFKRSSKNKYKLMRLSVGKKSENKIWISKRNSCFRLNRRYRILKRVSSKSRPSSLRKALNFVKLKMTNRSELQIVGCSKS